MNRKIEMTFEYENDDLIIINLTDENENSITKSTKEYYLLDILNKKLTLEENQVNFYNQMLADFNAEYDDDLAEVIDKIENKIVKKEIEKLYRKEN